MLYWDTLKLFTMWQKKTKKIGWTVQFFFAVSLYFKSGILWQIFRSLLFGNCLDVTLKSGRWWRKFLKNIYNYFNEKVENVSMFGLRYCCYWVYMCKTRLSEAHCYLVLKLLNIVFTSCMPTLYICVPLLCGLDALHFTCDSVEFHHEVPCHSQCVHVSLPRSLWNS